jgi:hypothetical protein
MNVFSVRSIGLYILAIGGAIGFFNVVTSYGETNIKAPIAVTGNYLITATNLPTCLQHKQLLIKLQQSGIYLNASVIDERQALKTSQDSLPTFSGRLNVRQFNLIGLLPTTICAQLSHLKITGSVVKHLPDQTNKSHDSGDISIANHQPLQLQGQLQIASPDGHDTKPIEFTGTMQPSIQSAQSH